MPDNVANLKILWNHRIGTIVFATLLFWSSLRSKQFEDVRKQGAPKPRGAFAARSPGFAAFKLRSRSNCLNRQATQAIELEVALSNSLQHFLHISGLKHAQKLCLENVAQKFYRLVSGRVLFFTLRLPPASHADSRFARRIFFRPRWEPVRRLDPDGMSWISF